MRRSPRSTGAGWSTSSGPGSRSATRPDRYRVAIERLTAPGHRGLLPGGARGAAAARRRPVARRPRRRRPLRRRPVADRDGPALPARSSWSASNSRRTRSPGRGRTSTRPGWPTGSRSARRASPRPGAGRRVRPRLLPVRAPPAATMPRRSCARPGRRCARAGGCSSSTGRCRPSGTSSGRGTASSSPASSSTSCTRAPRLATREQFLAWFAEAGLPGTDPDRPAVGRLGLHRRARLRARRACRRPRRRAMVGR